MPEKTESEGRTVGEDPGRMLCVPRRRAEHTLLNIESWADEIVFTAGMARLVHIEVLANSELSPVSRTYLSLKHFWGSVARILATLGR